MSDPVSVVIPARNEAATIAKVVTTLSVMPCIDEVVVVDNGSSDDTADVARRAGARAVFEPEPGMGHAIRRGFAAARNDWVMKLDADLEKFDTALFAYMPEARAPGVGLVKGAWNDPNDNMPMTRLLVMPAIRRLFPGLSGLEAPNSGIYMLNRSLIAHQELSGDYAADLDVMLRVHAAGAEVAEVDIGRIAHDARDLGHYNAMAETILSFFLRQQERQITEELVVLAQDANQVIRSSLGYIAARSRSGGPVTIYLDQTDNRGASILKDALMPFPTARVLPLKDAKDFTPIGPSGRPRFFAPYPSANEDQAIRTALQVQMRLEDEMGIDLPELLLMPLVQDRMAMGGFHADVALKVDDGHVIKRAALEQVAQDHVRDTFVPGLMEMFQTFDSLPDGLRIGLMPIPTPEAGNM